MRSSLPSNSGLRSLLVWMLSACNVLVPLSWPLLLWWLLFTLQGSTSPPFGVILIPSRAVASAALWVPLSRLILPSRHYFHLLLWSLTLSRVGVGCTSSLGVTWLRGGDPHLANR